MEVEHLGMPIYFDPTDRNIVDSLSEEEVDADNWYPSNKAAQKLWRCLECLRDLDELLEIAVNQKNAAKKKRRLKIAITPLYSLILAIHDLLNDIQCNEETSKLLKQNDLDQISKITNQFNSMLPHDHKAHLSILRNKLSSHIDKKLYPHEAKEIGSTIIPSEFGRWLHICLHLLLDLIKLNIYSWTCKSPEKSFIRLMTNEPFLVTFKLEEEIYKIVGIHIANSPKNSIPIIIKILIENSQWMFKPNQPRIGALHEDSKENWNTFLDNKILSKKF
jgi:hypothetical protein